MKIYLAARYSRRDEMRAVADQLRQTGHDVTSRWLETEWEIGERGSSAAPPEYRQEYALKDLEDVRGADAIVSFTEPPGTANRGGRHVEHGYAYALGKQMFVVGHYENIFHHLPGTVFFETTGELLKSFGHLPI